MKVSILYFEETGSIKIFQAVCVRYEPFVLIDGIDINIADWIVKVLASVYDLNNRPCNPWDYESGKRPEVKDIKQSISNLITDFNL